MTTFEDRKKAQESKFAMDNEIEFKILARRNKLLGEWAADKLQMAEEKRKEYAMSLVILAIDNDEIDCVLKKVIKDLESAGIAVNEHEVKLQMERFYDIAHEHFYRK